MKKLTILLGFVFIASFSAYTLTNHSEKSISNSNASNVMMDSTKCNKDAMHTNKNDSTCHKKDHSGCCKKATK
jgi:hypothetical protein